MGGAAGAELVVVGAGARGGGQRAERLPVNGVGGVTVAHEPREDSPLLPGRSSDRAGPGIVLAGAGVSVTAGVVAELGEHLGTEDLPQAGLGQDDLSVRVPAKMGLHLGFHHGGLLLQDADHRNRSADGGGISCGDNLGLGQLLAAQGSLDQLRLLRGAAAAGPLQRHGDLRDGQPGRAHRVGRPGQQLESIGGGQVTERLQRRGKNSRSAERSRSTCRVRSQIRA
jgi:hypothetical protein